MACQTSQRAATGPRIKYPWRASTSASEGFQQAHGFAVGQVEAGPAALAGGDGHDAEVPLGPELVQWAGLIVVMETRHREKLRKRFKAQLDNQQIVCLNIPDDYDFMDPELIQLLRQKVPPFLPDGGAAR